MWVLGVEQSEELGLYWIHCVSAETSFACLKSLRSEICYTIRGRIASRTQYLGTPYRFTEPGLVLQNSQRDTQEEP